MTKNENISLSHRLLVGFIVFGIGWDSYPLLMHQPTLTAAKEEIRLEMAQVRASVAAMAHHRI